MAPEFASNVAHCGHIPVSLTRLRPRVKLSTAGRHPSGLSLAATPHPTSNGAYRMLPLGARAAQPRWSGIPSPPSPHLAAALN